MISKEQSDGIGNLAPNVPMGDMSLIYQLVKSNGRRHTVTHTDLMNYRTDATQLHKDAFENAVQRHPAMVQTLEETLGLPPNMHPQVPDMYVVTNTQGELGAATILYPGMMEHLAEKCGGDYVILPSSVHEMLVVRAAGAAGQQACQRRGKTRPRQGPAPPPKGGIAVIENMTVGQFIETILAGGIYEQHCKGCDYWHKRGCSNGYVDCYYVQEAFVDRILKERKTRRTRDVPVPIECISCPYARGIRNPEKPLFKGFSGPHTFMRPRGIEPLTSRTSRTTSGKNI